MRRRLVAVFALVAVVGCSDPSTLTFELTLGHEAGAFQVVPAVSKVEVAAKDETGAVVASAVVAPGQGFDLGSVTADQFLQLEATGLDAGGVLQARGASLGVVIGNIASDVFPIFIQRMGEWSRPPGELPFVHVSGIGGALGNRYIMTTGGQAVDGAPEEDTHTLVFYDMLLLSAAVGGTFERLPKSVVVTPNEQAALFIDDEQAVWLDFETNDSLTVEAPKGVVFSEVTGGRVVRGTDASYLVGATRAGSASDKVLVVADDGTLSAATLTAPRQGAAATWHDGTGLVIVGGSASAAGVEVLADGATTAIARPYEAIVTAGAAVVPRSGSDVLMLCGEAGGLPATAGYLNLNCTADCVANELVIDFGATLRDCEAFTLLNGDVVVVGAETSSGVMQAAFVNPNAATVVAIPLKEPRIGATLVVTPVGGLALTGGQHPDGSGAHTVELLLPQ